MTKLETSLKWQWLRSLAFWNRQPIRAQGGWLSLIPVVAILISFAMAFYGNRNREYLETDIERKFQTTNKLADLMTLAVNSETGMRGYLLTGRPEFLEPYQIAVREIPPTIADLEKMSLEEPDEQIKEQRLARLERIKEKLSRQLDFFADTKQVAFAKILSKDELFARLQRGKSHMDELRGEISDIQKVEKRTLSQSLHEINNVRRRDYIFVIVALLIGLLMRVISFYLFDRGIVRRIDRLTENVRCLHQGEEMKFPFSKKTDALGNLEQELEQVSQVLGKNGNVAK